MAVNKGKQFEERFKKDWLESFPNSTITRLYDNTSGYVAISNISDYICYNHPYQFFIECKSHKGASIPFDKITQYDKMKDVVGVKGVRAGIILWLYDKDKVFYIPISTITEMKKDDKKSVGLKAVEEGYNIIEIPSEKLRVFMKSDYSCLMTLKDGE